MEGDPQLFGSAPGRCVQYGLDVEMPSVTAHGRITMWMTLGNRRDPAVLSVAHLREDEIASVLGYFIPLIVKAHYVGTDMMRRHLWAVHGQMGVAGKEVSLRGAGTPRKSPTP